VLQVKEVNCVAWREILLGKFVDNSGCKHYYLLLLILVGAFRVPYVLVTPCSFDKPLVLLGLGGGLAGLAWTCALVLLGLRVGLGLRFGLRFGFGLAWSCLDLFGLDWSCSCPLAWSCLVLLGLAWSCLVLGLSTEGCCATM
jgi:hypothetical protein